MSSQNVMQRIGQAWGFHRRGQNDQAINELKSVLSTDPDNVDAYYGLGLAHRANGSNDEAVAAFKKAYSLATAAYDSLKSARGDTPANDMTISDDDRFMMLSRMIRQRLAEMGTKPD